MSEKYPVVHTRSQKNVLKFSLFFGSFLLKVVRKKAMNFFLDVSENCTGILMRGQKNVLKFICEVRKMYSGSPERFFIRKNVRGQKNVL